MQPQRPLPVGLKATGRGRWEEEFSAQGGASVNFTQLYQESNNQMLNR